MIFYYIPFLYFFKNHARTKSRILSWFFIYILPVSLTCFFSLSHDFSVLGFLILVTLVYNVYELGYIYNDTETIKNEVSPTLRLSDRELEYYENHKEKIYSSRLLSSVFLISTAWLTLDLGITSVLLLSTLTVLLYLVYYWYNKARSRLNIFIGTLLGLIRYAFIPVALYFFSFSVLNLELILISFFLFPCINILTFLTKRKFSIDWAIKHFSDHDKCRVVYYLFWVVVIFLGIAFDYPIFSVVSNYDLLMLFLYFFLLRLVYLYIISSDGSISRSIKYARKLKYFEDKE